MPTVAVSISQSIAFLIFVAPLCLYVAWNDLRAMKIPTWSTDALALVFVVVGVFVMPFSDYMWRYAHFGVVLVVAMLLNALGTMGAGDSKFLASAAPFIAMQDVGLVFLLLGLGMLSGFAIHRAQCSSHPQHGSRLGKLASGQAVPIGVSTGRRADYLSRMAFVLNMAITSF